MNWGGKVSSAGRHCRACANTSYAGWVSRYSGDRRALGKENALDLGPLACEKHLCLGDASEEWGRLLMTGADAAGLHACVTWPHSISRQTCAAALGVVTCVSGLKTSSVSLHREGDLLSAVASSCHLPLVAMHTHAPVSCLKTPLLLSPPEGPCALWGDSALLPGTVVHLLIYP